MRGQLWVGEELGVALKANLKETQNSPAGLWETSAKVFLLCYFGFEMELKTYFGLTRPGRSGISPKSQGITIISQGLGYREEALKIQDALKS